MSENVHTCGKLTHSTTERREKNFARFFLQIKKTSERFMVQSMMCAWRRSRARVIENVGETCLVCVCSRKERTKIENFTKLNGLSICLMHKTKQSKKQEQAKRDSEGPTSGIEKRDHSEMKQK